MPPEKMTRAAYEAKEACPSCGTPWHGSLLDLCQMEADALESMRAGPLDPSGVLFDRHVANLRGLGVAAESGGRLSITQRGRRAAADLRREKARYAKKHGECKAGGHRVAGGPSHCIACCAPPPLSPEQVARIATLLRHPKATE